MFFKKSKKLNLIVLFSQLFINVSILHLKIDLTSHFASRLTSAVFGTMSSSASSIRTFLVSDRSTAEVDACKNARTTSATTIGRDISIQFVRIARCVRLFYRPALWSHLWRQGERDLSVRFFCDSLPCGPPSHAFLSSAEYK